MDTVVVPTKTACGLDLPLELSKMNELLQKHGCSNVFTVPEGLKELMSDISREVLRAQPIKLLDFIANYLSAMLITREHGVMAFKILDDLCDCRPTVSDHLVGAGLERKHADILAQIIQTEIEASDPEAGEEVLREYQIIKKVLTVVPLDEEMSATVCQVARNAYKDYWYRKELLKKGLKKHEEEPWEIAAQHTLDLYKRTHPSFSELNRATEKIQAAYKGYHIRRNVLKHLLPKKDKKQGRKVELTGPPLDVGGSREIDLGPVINIRNTVKEENVDELFEKEKIKSLGLRYDVTKMVTHEDIDEIKKHKKGVKLDKQPVVMEDDQYIDETPLVDKDAVKSDKISRTPPTSRISFSEVPPEVIRSVKGVIMEELPEVPDEAGTPVEDLHADLEEMIPEDLEFEDGDFTDVEDLTEGTATGTEGADAEGDPEQ